MTTNNKLFSHQQRGPSNFSRSGTPLLSGRMTNKLPVHDVLNALSTFLCRNHQWHNSATAIDTSFSWSANKEQKGMPSGLQYKLCSTIVQPGFSYRIINWAMSDASLSQTVYCDSFLVFFLCLIFIARPGHLQLASWLCGNAWVWLKSGSWRAMWCQWAISTGLVEPRFKTAYRDKI